MPSCRANCLRLLLLMLLCMPLAVQAQQPLVVFAAASLRTSLDQAVALWQSQQGGRVEVSYGGSSTLARQLVAGATADVFISASDKWMDYLADAGRILPSSRHLLVGNRLVLIAPLQSTATAVDDLSAKTISKLLGTGYLAMADRAAPAGSYGVAALTSLCAWSVIEPRVAWTQDVRGALALVAKGGAPLGIVYRTDATAASDDVKVIAQFSEAAHPPIHYPLAVLVGTHQTEAQRFADFLESAQGLQFFTAQGFTVANQTSVAIAQHSTSSVGGAQVWSAVALSLKVAFWAVLLSLPLALGLALLLARRTFPGKWLLDALLCLPLVMPPVVTGYVLLLLFGGASLPGRWLAALGIPLAFHWSGAVLAAAVMGFPLLLRSIRLSAESLDRRLEKVGATLGAHPFRIFCTITLPLLLPGIGGGVVLAFARAMGEFGATITFVANIPGVTQTLPLAIYSAIQTPGPMASDAALTLMGVSIGISLTALVLAEGWLQKTRRRVLPCN